MKPQPMLYDKRRDRYLFSYQKGETVPMEFGWNFVPHAEMADDPAYLTQFAKAVIGINALRPHWEFKQKFLSGKVGHSSYQIILFYDHLLKHEKAANPGKQPCAWSSKDPPAPLYRPALGYPITKGAV